MPEAGSFGGYQATETILKGSCWLEAPTRKDGAQSVGRVEAS
jgi:hypothetical protein